MKWVFTGIALLGFAVAAYFVVRPTAAQTVKLQPVVIPKNNPSPVMTKPTVAPKPTQPIRPRPIPSRVNIPAAKEIANSIPEPQPPQVAQTPPPRAVDIPETTTTSVEPTASQPPSAPSLTVRQDAGTWRLQAGAFRTQTNAESLQAKIQASGLKARVSKGEDGIYRVLVGNYNSSDAARAESDKVSSVLR